jgi:hypothetical protein
VSVKNALDVSQGAVASYAKVSELKVDEKLTESIILNFAALRYSKDGKVERFGMNSKKNWESTLAVLRKYSSMPEGKAPEDFYTNQFIGP